MELRNGELYVMGRFMNVAERPRPALAAVDATTGALDTSVGATFSDPRRNGALSILSADLSPDGTKLVAIGNFTKVNGLDRYQIAVLDIAPTGTNRVSVANWQTGLYGDGCSASFQSYMRDVDISPDGTYFVVATTGAYNTTFLCDTIARWDFSRTGSNLTPEWTNYSGGDTFTAVGIAQNVIYVGGHQNYMNNPYIGDAIGAGAVRRDGLAALDPRSGATLNWDPSRERGYGVYGFEITDTGLWIGSDTVHLGKNFEYHARLAFMPLATGTTLPVDCAGELPGQVVSLGVSRSGTGATLDRVATRTLSATGTSTSSETLTAGTSLWRNLRGVVHDRRQAVHRLVRLDVQGADLRRHDVRPPDHHPAGARHDRGHRSDQPQLVEPVRHAGPLVDQRHVLRPGHGTDVLQQVRVERVELPDVLE